MGLHCGTSVGLTTFGTKFMPLLFRKVISFSELFKYSYFVFFDNKPQKDFNVSLSCSPTYCLNSQPTERRLTPNHELSPRDRHRMENEMLHDAQERNRKSSV